MITYFHGKHSKYVVGHKLEIVFTGQLKKECRVVRINEKLDVVWLKLVDQNFEMAAPFLVYPYIGQHYYQVGFSTVQQLQDPLCISYGVISCTSPDIHLHIRGTSCSNLGDYGAGCFDSSTGNLIAINVGCDDMPISENTTLGEVSSEHLARSHLVPSMSLFYELNQ